ncbi:MAG: HNH endonuclease [Roseburia sp.]|nr:HNH endonuclease [Anaeroplasma bactoclasticum]MCM1196494.1 HNH endonuclease [Roseburia sp.]MCM1556959.1 HNH endonuclease [Anaeroplasma bactoclasticum]
MTDEEFLEEKSNDSYLVTRKKIEENETRLFLREVNYHCPICGKELQSRNQKKPAAKLFEIAHIFPNSPTKKQYEELKDAERLGENTESFENKIALCKDCHEIQDFHTTKRDYLDLLNKKKELLRLASLYDATKAMGLETEIEKIIDEIIHLSEKDMSSLAYTPVPLAKKFYDKEFLLKSKIAGYVSTYFPYIRELFKNMEGKNGFLFSVISKQIKACFEKMEVITNDKIEIFNQMVDWILRKTTTTSREAGEIVISFFVQNCEVFHEITK